MSVTTNPFMRLGRTGLTLSSASDLDTAGRPLMALVAGWPVVTGYFGPRTLCLRSNGLNCSRMLSRATDFWMRLSLRAPASWARRCRCFFDFWGPTMPWSRRDALRRFSCEDDEGIFIDLGSVARRLVAKFEVARNRVARNRDARNRLDVPKISGGPAISLILSAPAQDQMSRSHDAHENAIRYSSRPTFPTTIIASIPNASTWTGLGVIIISASPSQAAQP